MTVVTRFAPSPTGRLHLGHALSAILAHDRARAAGGRFLLRIEDIDEGRCRAEHVDTLIADLGWLGLAWDGEVAFQSRRRALYADALERLRARGLAYRCWCTRAEIAAAASAPHGDEGPLYPGTCRGRAGDPALPHAWRIDMARAVAAAGPLEWSDERAGRIVARPEAAGDVVIARKDAGVAYHLAVTVDDAAQSVSHVVRGVDLFAATHVHRLLQALLGLPVPVWHHHALLTGADGERLAKRNGAPALADLRAQGMDGRVLAARLREGRMPAGYRIGGGQSGFRPC